MHQISNYDIYIFDCDGVILDSNKLKIDAMKEAVKVVAANNHELDMCINYFSDNFGRSRFHHVDIFVKRFLSVTVCSSEIAKNKILDLYSSKCKELYLEAELTPYFLDFISKLHGVKYVASGSEQAELRTIFEEKGLNIHFKGIYGSPTPKTELIANILKEENNFNAVMFGDAMSDLESAISNDIDFIGYTPYSNVKSKLEKEAEINGFQLLSSWRL